MPQTFCPRHLALDDEDCNDGVIPCPPRVEVDPLRHVIVDCRACDKRRVAPVDRIMKGKLQGTGPCQLSECAATVVLPESELDKAEAFRTRTEPPLTSQQFASSEAPSEPEPVDPVMPEQREAEQAKGIDQAAKPRKAAKAQSGK